MKKVLFFTLVLVILLFQHSLSVASLLGAASDYNAFVFGDLDVFYSDSEGKVAAGGNIDMTDYRVGSSSSDSDYSLIAGGYVNFGPGSVWNGGVFGGGDVTLNNHYIYGKVTSNGVVAPSAVTNGTVEGTILGSAGAVNPIDFFDSYTYLSSTSLALAATAANGTTEVSYGNIFLTGNSGINYFNLNGSDLNSASSLTFDIGADDVAIVNVSGTSHDFSAMGISGASGKEGNIIYNFYESDQMSVSAISVKGSILAPDAAVNFDNGHINGTFIAASLEGTGEFHDYQFTNNVPVAPEPVSTTLFLAGGATLGFGRLRKRFGRSTN